MSFGPFCLWSQAPSKAIGSPSVTFENAAWHDGCASLQIQSPRWLWMP
jgi:hypothetical protein